MKFAFCVLFAIIAAVLADNYAVLVAGSNTFMNYRHQADICHSYQILHSHGIPDENIVVFMYDDIANSPSNKYPGKIINHPGGADVYHGVPKDFTGDAVTPANFLAVLRGESVGGRKTLRSGPNDNVFIFFADHGAAGLIAFPNEYLYANDLLQTLHFMHSNNKYNQLVFYLEACESGSMFQNLPDMNIWAVSAANGQQSSYAVYYDSTLGTYLGDVFSVNWMENSDATPFTETLQDQYNVVKSLTTRSEVCLFGTKSMGPESIGQFLSRGNSAVIGVSVPANMEDAVDSRDVNLHIYARQVAAGADPSMLHEHVLMRSNEKAVFDHISEVFGGKQAGKLMMEPTISNWNCYKESIAAVESLIGHKVSDYGLQYLRILANVCEMGYSASQIARAVKNM